MFEVGVECVVMGSSLAQSVNLGKSSDSSLSLPYRGRSHALCSQFPPIPASLILALGCRPRWGVTLLKVILGGDLADIQLVVNVCLLQLVSFFLETSPVYLHRSLRGLSWKEPQEPCR